jgi:hypothetical protein
MQYASAENQPNARRWFHTCDTALGSATGTAGSCADNPVINMKHSSGTPGGGAFISLERRIGRSIAWEIREPDALPVQSPRNAARSPRRN